MTHWLGHAWAAEKVPSQGRAGLASRRALNRTLLRTGFEARGLIFGAPLALALGAAFVPLRKPGKLPGGGPGHLGGTASLDFKLQQSSAAFGCWRCHA
jgi:hypothetical protein